MVFLHTKLCTAVANFGRPSMCGSSVTSISHPGLLSSLIVRAGLEVKAGEQGLGVRGGYMMRNTEQGGRGVSLSEQPAVCTYIRMVQTNAAAT